MKISVAIPTHDMARKVVFLKRSLDALWTQTEQDFEIIVSDNSDDDELKKLCEWYQGGIKYFRNPKKGMAQNTNAAIDACSGDLIKILYLDDFLAHDKALEQIWQNFEGGWLVTGCLHSPDLNGHYRLNPHYPRYSPQVQFGQNTIGSPSVLTIENKDPLHFDEEMTWLLDCDYYQRLRERYGEPAILDDLNVVIGLGEHQATFLLSDELKMREHEYLNKKYE